MAPENTPMMKAQPTTLWPLNSRKGISGRPKPKLSHTTSDMSRTMPKTSWTITYALPQPWEEPPDEMATSLEESESVAFTQAQDHATNNSITPMRSRDAPMKSNSLNFAGGPPVLSRSIFMVKYVAAVAAAATAFQILQSRLDPQCDDEFGGAD